MQRKLLLREQRICVICEQKSITSPWVICKSCGDFVANNWNKEAYRV